MEELIDIENSNKAVPNATAVLVLGICSIVGSLLYGIPGLICAIIALALSGKGRRMPVTEANRSSYEQLKAGRICAIIGLIISILILALVAVVVFIIVQLENTNFSR